MIERQFITMVLPSRESRDVEQTEGERGKRTRQSRENRCSFGVSILLKTDAKSLSMVHWEMQLVTYLRDTSLVSERAMTLHFGFSVTKEAFAGI